MMEKRDRMRPGVSLHQRGERKMLRGSLKHTHAHTRTTKINRQKQPGANSAYYTPHYADKWDPGLLQIICPPCPLHRCITSPRSSNCQAWSLQYTTPRHGVGQAEWGVAIMNAVTNWWICPLTHLKSAKRGCSCDLGGQQRCSLTFLVHIWLVTFGTGHVILLLSIPLCSLSLFTATDKLNEMRKLSEHNWQMWPVWHLWT